MTRVVVWQNERGIYLAQFVLGLLRLWDGLVLTVSLGTRDSDRSFDFVMTGDYTYVAEARTLRDAARRLVRGPS